MPVLKLSCMAHFSIFKLILEGTTSFIYASKFQEQTSLGLTKHIYLKIIKSRQSNLKEKYQKKQIKKTPPYSRGIKFSKHFSFQGCYLVFRKPSFLRLVKFLPVCLLSTFSIIRKNNIRYL
jgi:hypothetical protein